MKRIFMLVVVGLALVASGCDRNTHSMLPSEVKGRWTTEDPRYRDRTMELWPTFVITTMGNGEEAHVAWVDQVEIVAMGDQTQFKVFSSERDAGTHDELNFVYSPASGGEIRFRNQPQVWRRMGEPRSGE